MSLKTRLCGVFVWLDKRPFAALPLLSVAVTFILEVFSRHGFVPAALFLAEEPLMFLYNVLIVLLTLSVCMLAPKRMFAVCAVCALWLILGFINYIVLSYRTTPLGMIDLLLASSALKLINVYLKPWQIALIVLGIVALIVGGVLLYKRKPTLLRIIVVRLIINYGSNVLLGSVWKAMLYGKGYLYYLTSGAIKNTLMLPVEVFLMWAVLNAAVNYGLDRKYIHKR